MDEEFRQRLEQGEQLENRVALLETESGSHRRRTETLLAAEPLAPPADVDLRAISAAPAQPDGFPACTCDPVECAADHDGHAELQSCAISRRHDRQHRQSELSEACTYHVQDGASIDGTIDLLKSRGDSLSWTSEPDKGQSSAINLGFAGIESEIMAYLNSDDMLLPGTLAYVANYFMRIRDVDVVYGHRVFVDREGLEVGRAVLPPHDGKALQYADYIPQETMFWRKRVWDRIGPIDESLHYAMDWDFILRAQAAEFKFARLPRFLACFRIHDAQKTASTYAVGVREMGILRRRVLGFDPTQMQIRRAIASYLAKQLAYHYAYKLRRAAITERPRA